VRLYSIFFRHATELTPTDTPEFKAWFRNSKVVNPDGTPKIVFHGTGSDFDEFQYSNDPGVPIDRLIGFHFAEDFNIAERFANGLYDGNKGKVLAVYLSLQNPKVVHQPVYSNGFRKPDQYAINEEVANVVFNEREDLFIDWMTKTRNITADVAKRVYETLQLGKIVTPEIAGSVNATEKPMSPGEYVNDFGLINVDKREIAKAYREIITSYGYDGLLYINTSPSEVKEGDNPTTYIALYPTQIKSIYNKGTWNPNSANIYE